MKIDGSSSYLVYLLFHKLFSAVHQFDSSVELVHGMIQVLFLLLQSALEFLELQTSCKFLSLQV